MPEEKSKIGTPSEESLKLEEYISKKKDGEYVTYDEIYNALKINLRTNAGKGKFYTACRRLGRECPNKPNYGYVLSSPSNAGAITNAKVGRVISGTKRMVVAVDNVLAMHSDKMTEPQRQVQENTKIVGNAILGKARSAKKIIRKEQVQITEANPTV